MGDVLPMRRPYRLIYPEDFRPTKRWLIKGVAARGEISSWIGPPGAAKSAIVTDLCIHAARGIAWRGHASKGRCGVVYFALERAALVQRRLAAYQQRDGLALIDFATCPLTIDLMNPRSVQGILDTVLAAEDRFECGVGLAVIDTVNKGIAAGGGDEDKARDQNRVAANLRRVLERIDIHLATIGHTGKDASRGERGSNARVADMDVQFTITADGGVRSVTTTKANDQPEGPLTAFTLEPVELGVDEDGDAVNTVIVSKDVPVDIGPSAKRQKLSSRQSLALRALGDAILAFGQDCPFTPNGGQAVTEAEWRGELVSRSVIDADGPNPRARFTELRDALHMRSLIGIRNSFVWLS